MLWSFLQVSTEYLRVNFKLKSPTFVRAYRTPVRGLRARPTGEAYGRGLRGRVPVPPPYMFSLRLYAAHITHIMRLLCNRLTKRSD
jgi:hypothetical protein